MTRIARKVGGILAIAGGALMILNLPLSISGGANTLFLVIVLICGAVFIDGGIIFITDKTVGGILALIGGGVFFILSFFPGLAGEFILISFFAPYYIVVILAMVGAIIGLAVGPEFQEQ